MSWLSRWWPSTFQLLRYGTLNINTADHWDAAWGRNGREGFRATTDLQGVRNQVLAWLPEGAKLLDVGCGSGELLRAAAEATGRRGCGVDISPVAVAAVLDLGFDARVTVLPRIPYAASSFDAITCTETLEHVSDAKGTVDAMARLLRRGGRLIISVPDGPSDTEDAHVHRFTEQRLRRLIARHLTVREVRRITEETHTTLLVLAERDDPESSHFSTGHLREDLGARAARGGLTTVGTQGIKLVCGLASTMVLARLLTPEDYGLIGMVAVVIGFISLFKDIGLSAATVQRSVVDHGQISTLFWLNASLGVATALVGVLAAPLIAWFYREPRLAPITIALTSTFLCAGLTVQHQALLRGRGPRPWPTPPPEGARVGYALFRWIAEDLEVGVRRIPVPRTLVRAAGWLRPTLSDLMNRRRFAAERLFRELGFSPRIGLRRGLSLTIAHYRACGVLPV